MLAGLRLAAEQIEREEFEKIVNPPVIQFEFNFTKPDPEVDNR